MFAQEEVQNIRQAKAKLRSAMILKLASLSRIPEFANSYLDMVMADCYVTGGAIGSLLRGEEPNDFDIYFRTGEPAMQVRNFFQNLEPELKEVHIKEMGDYGEEITLLIDDTPVEPQKKFLITPYAITLNSQLQFITAFTGAPDVIRSTFDYIHCMPWFDLLKEELFISEVQYYACVNKKLVSNIGAHAVAASQKRIDKFISRGFTY